MNKLRRFYINYLMVPTLMPLIAAAGSAVYVAQEAETYNYTSFAWAWPHANEQTRAAIRDAMADGKISRWEASRLYRLIMDDVHALMTCPVGSDCRDITAEQAREQLQQVMTK
ncbi:hypothetical protein ABZQ20_32995 [Pseudomonas aeruginosa]